MKTYHVLHHPPPVAAPFPPAPLPNWLSWLVTAEVGEGVRREGECGEVRTFTKLPNQ